MAIDSPPILGERRVLKPEESASIFPGLPEAQLPASLWIDGNFDFSSTALRIAIVGSRRPSLYGMRVTRRLAEWIASHGAVIVSGLAYGVDRIAHEAALEAGVPTLAVIGTGLDCFYPAENRKLQEKEIPRQGAVLSEFPPGTPGNPAYFPARNRLIAALSSAVIVVEGNEKSGALITASHAANQGKEVFAVPGPIDSALSRAPNRLIRDGAVPLTSFEDLLELFPVPQNARNPGAENLDGLSAGSPASLTSVQREIWELLESGPMKLDEIAEASGFSLERVSQALMELQIAGIVRDWAPYGFARK